MDALSENKSIRRLDATGVVGPKSDYVYVNGLRQLFTKNTTLRDVIIRNVNLTAPNAIDLKEMKHIAKLDISGNSLKLAGAKHVAEFLETDNWLESLCVSNCSITQTGFNVISKALKNAKRLIYFEANANDLKDEQVILNTLCDNTKKENLSCV